MIMVRADANAKIGMGHLMRCLSVADAAKARGEKVRFIVADEAALPLLERRGQDFVVLGADSAGESVCGDAGKTDALDLDGELPKLLALLKQEKPEVLLIDSYRVTKSYLEQIRRIVRTAYMDDMFAFDYPVDVLINYNIYGDTFDYRGRLGAATRLLIGTGYAPLRSGFQGIEYRVREHAKHVLVTTGGSDRYDLAGQIVRTALRDQEASKLAYHVVSGAFNEHLPALRELEKNADNVHIYQDVQDMASLMRRCDIAVSAGGSTMYELSAVGVPVICFSFAGNQEKLVETFVQKGAACGGLHYREHGPQIAERIARLTGSLARDKELRTAYSERAHALVDGRGAERIAEELCGGE